MSATLSIPAPLFAGGFGVRDKVWQRQFVAVLGGMPQPRFAAVTGDRIDDAPLSDSLLASPGRNILKPRFGSNGVGVVRVVNTGGRLTVESDCPDTVLFLDEFPADPELRGRDVVAAVATARHRYLNRATAGLPEWAMGLSILEDEIRQDRADGSLFEPRIVAQRTDGGRFVTLGGICKRIDTPISAVVARDFREVSLEDGVGRFLASRTRSVHLTVDRILAAGDVVVAAFAPIVAEAGVVVHQLGIDGRLCWNAETAETEFWFLEVQIGIGRIDGPTPPGYRTPADLRQRFGPESG